MSSIEAKTCKNELRIGIFKGYLEEKLKSCAYMLVSSLKLLS
jgi:hypothetical protein